ncbi:C6 zinc finger domain-containing protein [Fusarium circinatum]|uniref:C6 zinc finger domain-containing protein n=1 Tax=Fusarium circinatum TaxID=48490 RepID=A0A8H5WW93_FUSCI|nr:C6 zinc finger domain-containing protein [Fusarium circinatum]
MEGILLKPRAIEFLQAFEKYSSHALPFINADKTRMSLDSLYNARVNGTSTLPDKALLLMILAIGALSTSETDTAETLLIHAKREVALFDDVTTLPMVQFCLLVSEYQLNMGRPNAAYLQVYSACNRAISMGLHDKFQDDEGGEDLQTRFTTFWAMYFQQIWICFTVGRKGILKRSDISCQYPDDQPMLVDLCSLASILEEMYESTRKLHLRIWGDFEDLWFGPSPLRCQASGADKMPQLLVFNALRASGQLERANAIWLRQACRYATDAAEDSIVLTHEIFKASDTKGKLINAVEGYIHGPLGRETEDPSSHTGVDQRPSDQTEGISELLPLESIMDSATSFVSSGGDYMSSGFLDLLPLDPSFLLMAEDGTNMVE